MQKTASRSRITARHAFFLGALVALAALLPAILPYGGRFVTRGDYIEQQLPFILETRRILRAGLDCYSFSTFLGAPGVGSYAFYTLGSPFVWPLALLPQALVPFGITVMAVLKHAVCALCSFLYFRQMTRSPRLALLGSVLYTFSAFTIVNTQFYHFTEVIAFFPLLLLGLEDAMGDAPHPGMLGLACGLCTLTNYYFMFSSAMLVSLYFLCRFFSPDWKNARSFRRVFRTVFECGVGCALAGVLLVPVLFFMVQVTRTGDGVMPLTLQVALERIRALLMPIESNVVHAFYGRSGSWCSTAAYLPAFGMTGVAVFLADFRSDGKNNWLRSLLLLLLACSFVPALCGAFALFSNSAYTRWWYGLSLMATLATLLALMRFPLFAEDGAKAGKTPWPAAFAALLVVTLLLILPAFLPEGLLPQGLADFRTAAYAPSAFRWLSVLLWLLGLGTLLFFMLKKPRFAAGLAALSLCAVVQYGVYIAAGDALILSGGTEAQNGVSTLSELAQPTLSALELAEPDEYTRIETSAMLRNYGLLTGRSSLVCFNSLRSSYVGQFVRVAGFGNDASTTVKPANSDEALRAFLSVGEYIRMRDSDSVPDGFVYDHEENGFAVYRNPNALPMGLLQTAYTTPDAQPLDENTVGETFLAAVCLSDADAERFADRLIRLNPDAIPDWKESAARLAEDACDSFSVTTNGFSAHISAKEAGLVVFTIPFDKGFSASVNGKKAEITLCDLSFMGVWTEPGENEIVFSYRTRGLTLGMAMSLMAGMMLAGLVLFRKKLQR